MVYLFLSILGAVVGSFLGALTWRWPRNQSILGARSRCSHCRHIIRWHDNIPVFSYLYLEGKCRDCRKSIPRRDFLIELGVAFLFPLVYITLPKITLNIGWLFPLQHIALALVLIIASVLAAIFIIDMEHQYIPDSLIFPLWLAVMVIMLVSGEDLLFNYLAAGFGVGSFLLILHLFTLGKGMGLGDVKLAVALGSILGFPLSVVWMFAAFVLGSVVGIFLIILGHARFKQKIAFGPFLVVAFFLVAAFGFDILNLVI